MCIIATFSGAAKKQYLGRFMYKKGRFVSVQ